VECITESYELEKQIGKGAYGTVCRARHKRQGTQRAIKSISKTKRLCNRVVERFKREIECLKDLDHPGIVRLYETFQDRGNIYMVMELCTGGELFSRLQESGHCTEDDTANVMQQIFRSVHYMHCSGVVHRDLKLENFLLLHNGPLADNVVKIVDFGFARDWVSGQMLTTKVGTPYYVAPQVLSGCYDNKSDLWSCGVVMYLLLAGYPPFMGKSDAEVFAKIRKADVTFGKEAWAAVSKDARDLIRCLLKFEPVPRYDAKQALLHKWTKVRSPKPFHVKISSCIVDRMHDFMQQNRLKKAALHVVAGQLKEESDAISPLRRTFLDLDTDENGLLSLEEMRAGLSRHGVVDFGDYDLQQIVRGIDTDGNESIDYTEFLAATLPRRSYTEEIVCRSVFDHFDLNGDGRLSQDEIRNLVAADGLPEAEGLRNAANLVAQFDQNRDGTIDFAEFMSMMNGARLEDEESSN
jgi:calcium-dependent protein kinase